ncbi:MAG: FAD-linked oxidase C-terminal domain-containing protein [Pseudomonadota bacterium]|nr:FAD-linked oxidase C-terminal domain-containing protein [Pseudomonadota bacterium]
MNLPELKEIFGERLSTSDSVRKHHSSDESWHIPENLPDAVIFPNNSEEVSLIIKFANDKGIPIIPFGAGTSLEGHIHAVNGGITINTMNMNKILNINKDDMDCVVQPGVTRNDLNEFLKDTGLFFPVDPGANATLGGMCATRASGTNTVRYGTIREQVMGLEVVMPNGKIIKTGTKARKSAAGYDLTHLMLGSEGTLGVITEITMKLHGRPEAVSAAICPFSEIEEAVNTVIEAIQVGLPLSRIELLDEIQIMAINRHEKMELEEKPTLFVEIQGSALGVREQIEIFGEIAETNNVLKFDWSDQHETINKLWSARHGAYYAALALDPGKKGFTTDVCVPISRLTECILETKKDLEESEILAPLVGHVGDGNFHLIMLLDPDNNEEVAKAKKFNEKLIDRALEMGGTSTGEHGIGLGKKDCLIKEQGLSIEFMKNIKKALDPKNIMNPGKIF